jgi:hypothetical protein
VKSKRNLKLTKEIKTKIIKSKVRRLNQIQRQNKRTTWIFLLDNMFFKANRERERKEKCRWNQTSYRINTRTTSFEREHHDLFNAVMNGQFLPPKSSARASWNMRSGLTQWCVNRTWRQTFFFKFVVFLNIKLSMSWSYNYKMKRRINF